MTISSGSSVVRNGLVFHYDMNNLKKSWRGKPLTNLATDTPTENGWAGSYTLVNSATKTFLVEVRQNSASTPSAWRTHYWSVSSYVGQTVTISMDVELISETNCKWSRTAVGQGNTGAYPYHIAGSDAADIMQLSNFPSKKTHFTWTGVINATGVVGISTWLADVTAAGANVVLRISNVMIEVNDHETRFVNGTRSNTEALVDLTGNNTITANSLDYNSDGTFSFSGSQYATITGDILNTDGFTVDAFVNIPNTTNINKTILGIGNGSSDGFWFFKHRSGLGGSLVFHGWDGVNPRIDVITSTVTPHTEPFHAAVTFNGSVYQLYLNGVANGNPVTDNKVAHSTVNYIGRLGSGSYIEGNIYDLKMYNRPLSAAEILQNYESGRGRYGI